MVEKFGLPARGEDVKKEIAGGVEEHEEIEHDKKEEQRLDRAKKFFAEKANREVQIVDDGTNHFMIGLWNWEDGEMFDSFGDCVNRGGSFEDIIILKEDGGIKLNKEVNLGDEVRIALDGSIFIGGEATGEKLWYRII